MAAWDDGGVRLTGLWSKAGGVLAKGSLHSAVKASSYIPRLLQVGSRWLRERA